MELSRPAGPAHPADPRLPAVVRQLRAAGCVFAEDEALLLVDAVEGGTGGVEPASGDLDALVARRVAGEPLEYILGWVEFHGRRVLVESGVFVPRRRTELLVDLALRHIRDPSRVIVVDLCCGSGAVASAILARLPTAWVHAADLQPEAVRCARHNLTGLGGRVHAGDLYTALPTDLRGRVDVLIANAPYVPSDALGLMPPEAREHEPRLALDGGTDGLDVLRRVIADAPDWLAPEAILIMEAADRQTGALLEAAARVGLTARVARSEPLDAVAVVASR
ncbi:putative protein N(5)-glutamine methyltransferase [Frankia sp. Ag45/Mut15]|uniref:peptide chain release factor N(5)-glutamine methyltransferase n=1 Tax=Frankia umida TaxID=573489 RepID=A0ABT0JZV5_9ACTN|nr:putative protein N(5)-glutamine methyltransferase [Frankia umida]MCK9877000.1 putative protein N(5)-glutamine methyltransferase [Frankia umida]